ncbi:MAG TPA: hypothetical protein VF974_00805 [Patescibacteria group bacterium]
MMPFDQEEIRPSYTDKGREYYNRTNSAKYVQMTDTGFRRKIQKIEAENGITIPMITRGGQQKLVDKRILDQFRKGIYVGEEDKWMEELKKIIDQIYAER